VHKPPTGAFASRLSTARSPFPLLDITTTDGGADDVKNLWPQCYSPVVEKKSLMAILIAFALMVIGSIGLWGTGGLRIGMWANTTVLTWNSSRVVAWRTPLLAGLDCLAGHVRFEVRRETGKE